MLRKVFAGLKDASAVIVLAAGLALPAPSGAATYTGKWDPSFGADFPDLGWKGEASFFIPDACLSHSGLVFNSESCSNSGMRLRSGRVDFYKLSDPTNAAFQESIFFNTPSPNVLAMRIDDGMLSGVLGNFNYLVPATLPLAGGPDTSYVLLFEDMIAVLGFVSNPIEGEHRAGFSDRSPPDGAPFIRFQLLPEPGSLALSFAALGMLVWFARRGAGTLARRDL